MKDRFETVAQAAEGEYKDRGSRFIGLIFPAQTEQEAKLILQSVKKEHHAAAHWCWALTIGTEGELQKSSDDREPSGTAGKPIAREIQAAGLTNVLVVVVRYFGGKLLGVPGLIQAYGEAAKAAIAGSNRVEKKVFYQFFVKCAYENQHQVIRILKPSGIRFYPDADETDLGITFEVPPSGRESVLNQLSGSGFEEITDRGIKIQ